MELQTTNVHWWALFAGVLTFSLGPLCLNSALSLSFSPTNEHGLRPLFALGVVYGLIVLVALGLGTYGLLKSRRAIKRGQVIGISLLGLLLTLNSLCCLLVVWGSLIALPCSMFGC
jgi:hypothetical protein